MTLEILSSDKVQVLEQVESWREAINIAASPLREQGYFQQAYIDDMIHSVEKLGPYIVIAPEIAIAHARPNNNVRKIGLSLLKLNQHINFSEEGHYASLVFVLSAIDNEGHLEVLRSLATTLGNQQTVNNLLKAQTSSEIINIFKGE
ncbi:PTS sugar transporter subunit IIA [Staphylococcus cohnii]|uniref:Ascorbate-specific PTS system EIIA component n=1 Tax=Staphylococcus cohnii subsp. cohnii TaxID=74704 RepID=A0A0M2P521_STACC|nr:PTS sugar transporter subunit IIA [Staphylococcus cohnii]TGP62461.1 PTS sugar transporter subunit IIA [bacterium M00.F.Ca.ET.229.01.1.1]TGS39294.1 PTS sugar transporter subunit IIA [bacterium M00.F.Ca.ET.180.01.1.1]AYX90833.1 PTS sugar transporter subunit IIA [Staphylococcus cohnii]KKI65340.1 PTS system, IIA component [Staphylococcus cohnii subsp. cohnii]MDE1710622.1 PTS sugar transporter subunit IIA [Staphylococcus cohnii]